MTKLMVHSWLDIQNNQVSQHFHYCHQKLLKQYFARNPNLWPIYKIKEIAELIGYKRNRTKPNNPILSKRLTADSYIPRHSSEVIRPFEALALFAAGNTKNWDDPCSVENVISTPCDPAIHGALLATIANPNLVYSEYAGRATELEKVVVRQMANLIGYDDHRATGLFTQGGTFCNLYGYLLGLRKCFPDSVTKGFRDKKLLFINSQAGHYSNVTNLSLLGVDIEQQLRRIKVKENNQIDVDDLTRQFEYCIRNEIKVPTILLTFGTTDTFAIDDIASVYLARERLCRQYGLSYRPHIHVDAAVGWTLSFFRDYAFERNELSINPATLEGLEANHSLVKGLRYADSITIDFQKWGYVPYTSSMILVKEGHDLDALKQDADYFSYFEPQQKNQSHLQSTIECSRSAVGVFAAYSALESIGIEGYQSLIAHGLQNANYLRCLLSQLPNCKVVSGSNQGPCVTFRLYPPDVKESPQALFYRERRLIRQKAYMESIVTSATYHRSNFLSRRGRYLKTNWVDSIARTDYNEVGHCLFLPGEKAVFLNPNTQRQNIESFVSNLNKL
ncbi:TPA: aspartate aminotransferase family protein [Vibrio vulnificus]|nr:aspartate aminotransferase family protein [Vibrio vulnificus]